jgi:hypothetical protein
MNKASKGVEGKPGDESSSRKVPAASQANGSIARSREQPQGASERKGKTKTEAMARKRRSPFVL